MDLMLTPEQTLLVETASSFATRSVDSRRVRAIEASEDGFDHAHWEAMVELGWSQLEPLDLALVAEQLGRAAMPSPLPITAAMRNALPELAATTDPRRILTLGALVPGSRDEESGPHPFVDRGVVSASFVLVPYALHAMLVLATASNLVLADSAHAQVRMRRHDTVGGDAMWRVDLDRTPTVPVRGALRNVLDHLAVTSLAYTVGAAEGALALAVRHAKDRHQFGRPIGSFQAVAHRCAEMRVDVDACRYLAYRAAWALGARRPDVRFAVDSALSYSKEALRRVAMHAHQVHGAIGFSTEHDLHLFTRRIKAFELTGGAAATHQDRFATSIGLMS